MGKMDPRGSIIYAHVQGAMAILRPREKLGGESGIDCAIAAAHPRTGKRSSLGGVAIVSQIISSILFENIQTHQKEIWKKLTANHFVTTIVNYSVTTKL